MPLYAVACRRALVLGVALLAGACATPQAPPPAQSQAATPAAVYPTEELSITEIQARMAAGELSAYSLVEGFLQRIEAIDRSGPTLNSIIELNPDALSEALRLDEERAAGQIRGPMHGVPVLLKDNIDAAGMVNSAGSLALASHRPAEDAFVVARLREAGAIILGKANLSEWANFRSTRSTSGWSSRGGQTRNPYLLDRNPCGSSSGSATAVAANLVTVAVGTETDGSIMCPAAVTGLVGIKPTLGLVSRQGIIPIAISQDTAGPMARTVADAAALLGAMAGADPRDPEATVAEPHIRNDYTVHLRADGLAGARIGVVRETFGFHPGVDAVLEAALETLQAAGAELVDPVEIATHEQYREAEYAVLLHEFREGLNGYLVESGAPIASLAELIAFNRAHAEAVMPWFEQEILELAESVGSAESRADYLEALDTAKRLARVEGLEAALAAHGLDALLTAAVGPAWPTDPINGDHFLGAGYSLAAVAGTPSLTVPAGTVNGLPIGIVFMGPAWSEGRLIELAHAFEQHQQARRPPALKPTLPMP
ncbi:MAG: amidase, partial [Gammaproteobacteria bacterium]